MASLGRKPDVRAEIEQDLVDFEQGRTTSISITRMAMWDRMQHATGEQAVRFQLAYENHGDRRLMRNAVDVWFKVLRIRWEQDSVEKKKLKQRVA